MAIQGREEGDYLKELRYDPFAFCDLHHLHILQSVLIQALDYGKDVESVENLIRRHEEMEREISVIKSKMEVRSAEV